MTETQARSLLDKRRVLLRTRLGLAPPPTSTGHGDDLDAEASDRTVAFASREQLTQNLKEIDDALDRIAAGRFGLCVDCAGAIPAPRLRARPEASRCVPCERLREDQDASLGLRPRLPRRDDNEDQC